MNLLETLKEFKKITPDSAYKEHSKRVILATDNTAKKVWYSWGIRRTVAAVLETGVAVALMVFCILVVSGHLTKTLSPVQFSVINPETLNAEAQAVDIQIQLAQVAYDISTTTAAMPQATAAIVAKKPLLLAATPAQVSDATSTQGSADATQSSSVSIDQALQALSQ